MLRPKKILKELTPPALFRLMVKLYLSCSRPRINSSNRFQGKVFCIGFNKTGTTSIGQALIEFGYSLGSQSVAEMLLIDWHRQDFDRLIRFCQTADAFQDIPFSLPGTYRHIDEAFPDAKFILTVRDTEQQWFQSLVRFHTKWFSSDKSRLPDENDLKNALYLYKGSVLDAMRMVFNYPTVALYDEAYYTQLYQQHNQEVTEYFKDKTGKLLKLNLSHPIAYQELAAFLNITVSDKSRFPWKNKTQT
ncbi:MAG: hypothetical protein OEV87_12970 [Phycisphaerae bacterium]|nr:hypothetical protein [Phycisphaerae bacterium]